MRLSLAWIFDHLKLSFKDVDIERLIEKFDATTAEIEEVVPVTLDPAHFTLARITKVTEHGVTAESAELKKSIKLPERKEVEEGALYLLKKEGRAYRWATMIDLGSSKDGLMSSVWCPEEELKGAWKEKLEKEDFILVIDNKSLTHRPDLWGHRGIAREIAAILHKPLVPEEMFLVSKPIKHYARVAPVSATNPFTLEIAQETGMCAHACKRLAGLYIPKVENRASSLHVALRLVRVDARPINALVDPTNYVMFDLGQPLHAFDAGTIKTRTIMSRCAKQEETVELLDGEKITLTATDYVITDGVKPLSLAGIMGGKETAISKDTHALYVESANFDPIIIRKSSTRIKKRTESSARFEKSLDPNQNTQAILRYLKVLEEMNVRYTACDAIASIGPLSEEKIIIVSQELIDKKIGMHIPSDTVERTLTSLGFGVKIDEQKEPFLYAVTVPTFRGTKDVTIAEDIIEEVARFVGYDTIIPHLPTRVMAPFNTQWVHRLRAIKKHLAFALSMQEAQTYAFFDEEFLRLLRYEPEDALRVANPLSEHWQRLITSLVPNILKCVYSNQAKAEVMRFFEFNRIWFYQAEPVELQECSGILFEHKKPVDFYECKVLLSSLFDLLKIKVVWQKPTQKLDPWYNEHQTAELFYQGRIVGRAGKVAQQFLQRILEGDAFIFELDGNFLLNVESPLLEFKPLEKYPEVHLDISILVPLKVSVKELEDLIKKADPRIKAVRLLDFYQKPEWKDQKSVTCRFIVYDEKKTLTKDEIDAVWNAVVKNISSQGTVR